MLPGGLVKQNAEQLFLVSLSFAKIFRNRHIEEELKLVTINHSFLALNYSGKNS